LSSRLLYAQGTGERTLDQTLRAQSCCIIGIQVRSTLRAIRHAARVPIILCISPDSRVTFTAAIPYWSQVTGWQSSPGSIKKEIIMKRSTIAFTAITAFALAMTPGAKAEDKGCTNHILQGTFAYTATGSAVAPPQIAGAAAEVGQQTFDGRGGTTITATLSSNGNLVQFNNITGTYTVNPDCTGTFAVQVAPNFTLHVYFVIDSDGNGFQAIETEPGLIITRVGRRLFPGRTI
jgi:hypothetical protein